MIKWIRTSRLSIKNNTSPSAWGFEPTPIICHHAKVIYHHASHIYGS
jgi:hypothetical protein